MAFLCHCKAYFWIIFGTFSKVSHISSLHMTSSMGAIIPQTMMILPLKCFAYCLTAWGSYYTREFSLPMACSYSCWYAQLVLSQEAGNHGGRPPNIPWFPADPLQNPIVLQWSQRQETHHSSKHNSVWLGSVEYALCSLLYVCGSVWIGISVCVLLFLSKCIYVWMIRGFSYSTTTERPQAMH